MNSEFDPDEMPEWLSSVFFNTKKFPEIVAGINDDDCAVIKFGEKYLVITTDYLNARPIAFEMGIGGFWDLGRLMVASNLSDLCGTGAKPICMLSSIMMQRDSSKQDFVDLMNGIKYELDRYNIPLVGGDTKLGESNAILGVAIGSVNSKSNLFLKNGAKPGDTLWASNYLGSMTGAVLGLKNDKMSNEWKVWAKKIITEPRIPIKQSNDISELSLGRGGIDISDGLGSDLFKLCNASGVGVIIEVDNIPIEPEVYELAEIEQLPPWIFAFGIGGDFQFIVSTPEDKDIQKILLSQKFYPIGRLTKKMELLLHFKNGKILPMPQKGHRDFRNITFSEEVRGLVKDVLNKLEKK
jgi:thiamine-monophosphate kinase